MWEVSWVCYDEDGDEFLRSEQFEDEDEAYNQYELLKEQRLECFIKNTNDTRDDDVLKF